MAAIRQENTKKPVYNAHFCQLPSSRFSCSTKEIQRDTFDDSILPDHMNKYSDRRHIDDTTIRESTPQFFFTNYLGPVEELSGDDEASEGRGNAGDVDEDEEDDEDDGDDAVVCEFGDFCDGGCDVAERHVVFVEIYFCLIFGMC